MKVRVPIAGLADGEHTLEEATAHYVSRVLRLREGDRFLAFDPETREEADVVVIDGARVRVETIRPAAVVASTELVLVYALAKGDKVDAVVRDATELGATRIVLARGERSVVKIDDPERKLDRWRRIAEQAARQCGRADPPAIDGVHPWSEALDRAPMEARFCLDPASGQPLGRALGPAAARGASIAFAIGPEGGLAPKEIAAAVRRGWTAASLGPFVLRTETVAAAVLGAVRVLSSL